MVGLIESHTCEPAMTSRFHTDEPIRMPRKGGATTGAYLEAQRQFRLSMWVLALFALGGATVAMSPPMGSQTSAISTQSTIR